jgi:hypothetical protein
MNQNENVVMAQNPYNKKLVNVLPLFDLQSTIGFEEAKEELDNVIKLLVCNANFEPDFLPSLQASCSTLYELRDLFGRLQECEITMKGGSK